MSSANNSKIRWIDLSDKEKMEVLRIRNAESARKSRKKKKDEDGDIHEIFKSNEKRIKELEKVAHNLSSELRSTGDSSTANQGRTPSRSESSKKSKKSTDQRPEWFGDPF